MAARPWQARLGDAARSVLRCIGRLQPRWAWRCTPHREDAHVPHCVMVQLACPCMMRRGRIPGQFTQSAAVLLQQEPFTSTKQVKSVSQVLGTQTCPPWGRGQPTAAICISVLLQLQLSQHKTSQCFHKNWCISLVVLTLWLPTGPWPKCQRRLVLSS